MKIWENCVNLLNQEDHTLRVKEITYKNHKCKNLTIEY